MRFSAIIKNVTYMRSNTDLKKKYFWLLFHIISCTLQAVQLLPILLIWDGELLWFQLLFNCQTHFTFIVKNTFTLFTNKGALFIYVV